MIQKGYMANNLENSSSGCSYFGCLLQINEKNDSLFGDIFNYCRYGITFNDKDNYEINSSYF